MDTSSRKRLNLTLVGLFIRNFAASRPHESLNFVIFMHFFGKNNYLIIYEVVLYTVLTQIKRNIQIYDPIKLKQIRSKVSKNKTSNSIVLWKTKIYKTTNGDKTKCKHMAIYTYISIYIHCYLPDMYTYFNKIYKFCIQIAAAFK